MFVNLPVDLVLLVGQPSNVSGTAALDRVLHLQRNLVTTLTGNWRRAGCAGRSSRDPTMKAPVRPASRKFPPTCTIGIPLFILVLWPLVFLLRFQLGCPVRSVH